MAAKNLTAKAVQAAKPGAHVVRLRDGAVKGFHLVIQPNGTRSWALSYTSPTTGKRRNTMIGPGSLSLSDARDAARVVREQIRSKIDPIEQKARDKALEKARQEAATVEDLLDHYIRLQLKDPRGLRGEGKKKRGKRSSDSIRSALKKHSDSIVALKPGDVTPEQITSLLGKVSRTAPVQANRVRTYLHAAFKFGLTAKLEPKWSGKVPDFGLLYNPVTAVPINKEAESVGERSLSPDEVRQLWYSIGVDALSADLALALKLLLATGQRTEEVLQATWSEFDFEEMTWTIPWQRRKSRNKCKVDHVVPLTDFHVGLLDEIWQYAGNKYLFPHKNGKKPRGADALSQAVFRYCRPGKESRRTPVDAFTPRDLRRTWKTLAAPKKSGPGLDLEIRNRLQGHAFSDVGSLHYDKYSYLDEKRVAIKKWTRWLEKIVTGKTAKVVQIA